MTVVIKVTTLPPPHGEEDRRLVSGFLEEVVHCLGFHSRFGCCNCEDDDDIDDEHYDNVFVFVCVFVFVFVIVIMVDLSTDDVAARRGWVTMSTRLCDSCKVGH